MNQLQTDMIFPVHNAVGDLVRQLFPGVAGYVNGFLTIASLLLLVSLLPVFLIWLERKVAARFQARLGPMRVGYHGLLQSTADGLKLVFKEVLIPEGADRFVFFLAPILPASATFLVMTILPFDHHLQVADPAGGVIYVIGISGLGILGILLAGWASNNKYSLLGAMRSGAQLISFEISLALIMLLIVMVTGTASLREIVLSQQGTMLDWWIFKLPVLGFIAFVMYMISSTAELNRAPFDISEAESELTGGFATEYSGISFAMFFFAEFVNMFVSAGIATTLFLGGFLAPQFGIGLIDAVFDFIPGFVWFFCKTFLIIFLYMWFRWSFPRLRVDQLMYLEWKMLLPANLVLLIATGLFLAMGWTL
jgi:NADH-quinone oxidoreductase subunit H